MNGSRRAPAVVEPGWWDAHFTGAENPREVVATVEGIMPDHPALPRLRQIAEGWEHAQSVPEAATRRCPSCDDNGWVETIREGRGQVRACVGPYGHGCPAIAWKIDQAHKMASPARGPRRRGTESEGL